MRRSGTCVMAGVIIFSLVMGMGGFLFVEKALAGLTDPCPNNPKTCTQCQCKVFIGGNKVTVGTASAVLKCSKNPHCNNPGNPPCTTYDLNCDGKVNLKDYQIAQKCIGCTAQPSPFK